MLIGYLSHQFSIDIARKVSPRLPGRSLVAIQKRFERLWEKRHGAKRVKPPKPGKFTPWTKEEERILLNHFSDYRFTRNRAALLISELPGRTISAMENRLNLLRNADPNFNKPSLKWTREDDAALVDFARMYQWKTYTVADKIVESGAMPTRTRAALIRRLTDLKKDEGLLASQATPKWEDWEDELLDRALGENPPSTALAKTLQPELPRWSVNQIAVRLRYLNQLLENESLKETEELALKRFIRDLPSHLIHGQREQAISIARYDIAAANRYIEFCQGILPVAS